MQCEHGKHFVHANGLLTSRIILIMKGNKHFTTQYRFKSIVEIMEIIHFDNSKDEVNILK